MSDKCACAKLENTMHTLVLYNLYHNMYLSQNCYVLSYAIHTFQVSPQCQACSKSRERNIRIYLIHLKKNKQDTKSNIFVFSKNFQCF